MFGHHFYHEFLRKYVIIFGTLFNDIRIARDSISEAGVQRFKVPIAYGPREKALARLEGDADIEREVAITLPRISFEVTNLEYDATRKLNTMNRWYDDITTENNDTVRQVWNPVPYNIYFQLNVVSKTVDDATKIVEQIFPYFTPDWTVSAKLIDNMPDVILDIPVILNAVNTTDLYEGDFAVQRRAILWTLDFTMKGWFFGPVLDPKVIKVVKANIYTDLTSSSEYESVTVKPGLTADGDPTSFITADLVQATATATISSNSVATVSMANQGFGYASANVTFSDPPSGYTAQGRAIIRDKRIVGIEIRNPGDGYVTAPTITITGPDLGTVAYSSIDETDDYGYVVTVEDFFNE